MTIVRYSRPVFNQKSFTCPHCHCFSQHEWRNIVLRANGQVEIPAQWVTSWCLSCGQYCFWRNQRLVWPLESGIPDPTDGCPGQIHAIYDEARSVFPMSPRAAAALLRLAIQLVCKERGLAGENLNQDIGSLVSQGLPAQIQQSLDLVRVVGNNAVHPGQIVIEDNREHIEKFFGLVNLIVDVLIVQPAKINEMFSALVPEAQQRQIEARDGKP